MSLKLEVGRSVPKETRRVAKAAFPKGNVYLWIGDELGELYSDHLFIDLYLGLWTNSTITLFNLYGSGREICLRDTGPVLHSYCPHSITGSLQYFITKEAPTPNHVCWVTGTGNINNLHCGVI